MSRVVITGSTTAELYETTNNADARLYYVVTSNLTEPTGEQIEAGLNAAGGAATAAGSSVVVVGENGPFYITGLTLGVEYKAFVVQNLTDYKGHYQGFMSRIGAYTFTRALTQSGINAEGDVYTAQEDEPAYILRPEQGIQLQSDAFDANGETSLQVNLSDIGLNEQVNNYSGQIIFTTRTDQTGLGSMTFVSINHGPAWGNSLFVGTSSDAVSVQAQRLADGSTTVVGGPITNGAALGDRFDIRFRFSSTAGITLWNGSTKSGTPSADNTDLAQAAKYLTIGARWNDSEAKASFTCEFIRLVDSSLSDAEIEAW